MEQRGPGDGNRGWGSKEGPAKGRTAQPSAGSGVSAGKGWGGCGKQRHKSLMLYQKLPHSG